ncbi:MAG: metallophosphoesterase [Bacteroidota bacterium]|nr:metallophosphoesterase [Bacteroidota bacterium]
MIRILHISDFHLNSKTLKDWKQFVKGTLTEKTAIFGNEKSIDLILYTGDLIDIGGKDLGDAAKGFALFRDEVI